jgi:aspartate aminotransferase
MFEEGNALKRLHGPERVFDFSLGNPDLEPPPEFHRVLVKLATEDKKGSHGYMPNAGFPEVREALAAKAAREHQTAIDGSHIVMAVGAAGGLNTVCKTICNPGDEIVVSRPYFVEYRAYAANHGAALIEADTLPDFDLDLDAIGAALSPRTAAVLINSPNNPTGKIYRAQTIARLAALLTGHGSKTGRFPYLIADEPYREIAYDLAVPPVLNTYAESIVVSSCSKSLSLPGERIGYIAVSPAIADKETVINGLIYATRVLGYVNAPALMQRVVAELTEARVDVAVYARRRDAFIAVLEQAGISCARPDGAFYLFCKTPPRRNSEGADDDGAFAAHLKKHLILGVPGAGFGTAGWLRFAYCVDETIIRASAGAFRKAMSEW